MDMQGVSIEGLDKADVLAALYNASKPQGLGFMYYTPTPMTHDEAEKELAQRGERPYFDHLNGRVMKIRIEGDELDPRGYDRDNGKGACAAAIAELRRSGETNPETSELRHLENTRDAAQRVMEHLHDQPTSGLKGNVLEVGLGFADVADVLKPHVEDVIGEE